MASADLLLHPVRLRIVQAFLGDRALTTTALKSELPEVLAGSLYRYVARLVDGGVLAVVSERRVRRALERTCVLRASAAHLSWDEIAKMTPDEHRQAFLAFVAGLIGDADRQTGILKGRRRRAVDSTILADGVATQDTVTQLVAAVRRVAREVPGAADRITEVCTGHDYGKPGKPAIDWDDPAAKDALVSALVNDANAVVAAFQDAGLEEPAASALALLALVAGQDVEPAEGSDGTDGRWRIVATRCRTW